MSFSFLGRVSVIWFSIERDFSSSYLKGSYIPLRRPEFYFGLCFILFSWQHSDVTMSYPMHFHLYLSLLSNFTLIQPIVCVVCGNRLCAVLPFNTLGTFWMFHFLGSSLYANRSVTPQVYCYLFEKLCIMASKRGYKLSTGEETDWYCGRTFEITGRECLGTDLIHKIRFQVYSWIWLLEEKVYRYCWNAE